MNRPADNSSGSPLVQRFLNAIEWAGNKLPDPAFLFVWAILITMLASRWLAPVQFSEVDPRKAAAALAASATTSPGDDQRIQVIDQTSGAALVGLLAGMVKTFTDFPPLGVVIVALLGVGVAEHAGLIQAMLKALLRITPAFLLTPTLIFVALISHSAGDTGYVLIIPLGAVMFQAAGRHPLLGITAAFAGVSGGFSANFLPSSLDPLLQGFTQKAAQIIAPSATVNPLCNYWIMTISCIVITAVGWYVTDRIIAPRLQKMPVDGQDNAGSSLQSLSGREYAGLTVAALVLLAGLIALWFAASPADSPFRDKGSLTDHNAPMMKSIVPLIFLLFLIPGALYGAIAGTIKSHRDIVAGMTRSMGSVTYYLVMAFFASQFAAVFSQSNIGVLLAVKGANFLTSLQAAPEVTVVGIILLTSLVNLLIGSASAKWALLSPIFVPMLMSLGLSPELTQAAYRIGDSGTNIITPLMPYFPLVVSYAQKYVKSTGVGTMISLMLPYSMAFLISWTVLLLIWWGLGLPLGTAAGYSWPPGESVVVPVG
ncbi:MAG: AbgT family transporter [Planctomycetota bacterium]